MARSRVHQAQMLRAIQGEIPKHVGAFTPAQIVNVMKDLGGMGALQEVMDSLHAAANAKSGEFMPRDIVAIIDAYAPQPRSLVSQLTPIEDCGSSNVKHSASLASWLWLAAGHLSQMSDRDLVVLLHGLAKAGARDLCLLRSWEAAIIHRLERLSSRDLSLIVSDLGRLFFVRQSQVFPVVLSLVLEASKLDSLTTEGVCHIVCTLNRMEKKLDPRPSQGGYADLLRALAGQFQRSVAGDTAPHTLCVGFLAISSLGHGTQDLLEVVCARGLVAIKDFGREDALNMAQGLNVLRHSVLGVSTTPMLPVLAEHALGALSFEDTWTPHQAVNFVLWLGELRAEDPDPEVLMTALDHHLRRHQKDYDPCLLVKAVLASEALVGAGFGLSDVVDQIWGSLQTSLRVVPPASLLQLAVAVRSIRQYMPQHELPDKFEKIGQGIVAGAGGIDFDTGCSILQLWSNLPFRDMKLLEGVVGRVKMILQNDPGIGQTQQRAKMAYAIAKMGGPTTPLNDIVCDDSRIVIETVLTSKDISAGFVSDTKDLVQLLAAGSLVANKSANLGDACRAVIQSLLTYHTRRLLLDEGFRGLLTLGVGCAVWDHGLRAELLDPVLQPRLKLLLDHLRIDTGVGLGMTEADAEQHDDQNLRLA